MQASLGYNTLQPLKEHISRSCTILPSFHKDFHKNNLFHFKVFIKKALKLIRKFSIRYKIAFRKYKGLKPTH